MESVTSGAQRPLPVHLIFAAIAAGLFFVAGQSVIFGQLNDVHVAWRAFEQNPWLDGWCRWDALWYRAIARNGYWYVPGEQSAVAFFPAYPLLIAGLEALTSLRPLRLAVIVTLLSGLASMALLDAWCGRFMPERPRFAAVVTLLTFPFAFFLYGAAYSDALFLFLALASFVLLERDQPLAAGATAMLATATRSVGLALIVGLAIRAYERRVKQGERPKLRDLGVLLAPLGFGAYLLYLEYSFDTPLAFVDVQKGWGQAPGLDSWLKLELWKTLSAPTWELQQYVLLLHAGLTLFAVAMLPRIWRRFGLGYASYVAIAVAIPAISSKDFMGLGRYLLAAFPLFAVVGELLAERPRLRWAVHGVSAGLLVTLTSLFARWYYVS